MVIILIQFAVCDDQPLMVRELSRRLSDYMRERPVHSYSLRCFSDGRSLLVFVTVLRECVFDAFEVEAWDYLVKPLDGARFERTMDRMLRQLERRRGGERRRPAGNGLGGGPAGGDRVLRGPGPEALPP